MSAPGPVNTTIPLWYLTTFDALQHLDGGLRNLELEVRAVLRQEGLDNRVHRELLAVLDALHTVKGQLVLADMTARAVVDEALARAA
jgi:hypothetical protein